MPARFNAAYMAKIRREVTRYQKERSRLIRTGIQGGTVPPRVTVKKLLSTHYSRREMNKALKEMSLFTAGKALRTTTIHGKVTSQYEVERFRLLLGRERKATARELQAVQRIEYINPIGHDRYVKKLQARARELNKSWEELLGTRAGAEVLAKATKSENLYSNWVNALFQDAVKLGMEQSKIDEIIQKLNKLTPQQFERMYYEDPAITYIFGFYAAEVKGSGSMDNAMALDAFESIYQRIDDTIRRYTKLPSSPVK